MSTAVIAASAVLFLAMGVLGLVAPDRLTRPFGIGLGGPDGRTETRAVYGGFGVAMAVLLALSVIREADLRPGAVIAVAVALLGMAAGRVVSRLVERPRAFYPNWLFFWVEAVIGLALLWAA